MNSTDLDLLMDAVLDGDAAPQDAQELDRILAADPVARERFAHFRRIFTGLEAVPEADPPRGLADRIMERIALRPPRSRLHQRITATMQRPRAR